MSIVYKFLPLNRLSYIEDELLRFTQPIALNDPFECTPFVPEVNTIQYIDFFLEKLRRNFILKCEDNKKAVKNFNSRKIRKRSELIKKFTGKLAPEFLRYFLDHTNQNIGIFSLSTRWNSSVMWAHYTISHRGFCLGYNSFDPFFNRQPDDPNDIGKLTSVEYSKKRICMPLQPPELIGDLNVWYTKSCDWEYEQEERLIRNLSKASKTIPDKLSDIFLFKVPHSALAEIICGVKMINSDRKKLITFAHSLNIPIYESLLSTTQFDMERQLINP